jgi:hypothetical protein
MAAMFCGTARGKDVYLELPKAIIAESSRRAANVRHAKARVTKANLQAWYKENRDKFRSMESAAAAAARSFPVAHRTAYDYIAEIRRQERSARKA